MTAQINWSIIVIGTEILDILEGGSILMSKTPAEKISAFLTDNGIKQNFLAGKTGINKSTLSSILKGETKLSTDRLELICGVLGKEPNDFVEARLPESVEQ